MGVDNFLKDLFQLFLTYMEVNLELHGIFRNGTIYKAQILRQNLIEDETSEGRLNSSLLNASVSHLLLHTDFDSGLEGQDLVLICENCLVDALEVFALLRSNPVFPVSDSRYQVPYPVKERLQDHHQTALTGCSGTAA